jgi:site-specific DNA-methyltransferase (adenine-specific)
MNNLKIDKEFEKLIPKLTDEEFFQLEENCKDHGIQDSIKIWSGENIIIDGHNRYKIAQKNNIQYETEYMSFDDRGQVIEWMLINQLGRRNLNNYDRSIIALKLEGLYKIKAKENQGKRTDLCQTSDKSYNHIDTKKEIAEKAKVSHDTLNKVKHIEKKADKEIKNKLKNGEITVNKAYQDIKKAERKKENEEKIKKSANKKIPSNIKLLEGDLFEQVKNIPDNSIDLLCTDPPYFVLDENWDTFKSYDDFLIFTEKWLNIVIPKIKNTGRLYISFPCDFKFDLYNILKKNNFYNFIFGNEIIWVKRNNNQMSNKKNYRYQYESILYLYGKNADKLNFTEYGEIQSNVWEIAIPQSNFKEGKFHPTQKPKELYRRIIKTGSIENDLILDCFAGSGTTGVICKELNKNCILIEKEKKYIDIIKGRINNVG